VALVPRLSSGFLPAPGPQAPGFALPGKTIRRWGQRAILAVFGHLLLQPFDLFRQLFHLLFQQAISLPKFDQFFFCCHAATLPDGKIFGKPLGDLTSYDFSGVTQPDASGRNSRVRWFQLLAVILLVCLIGGGFVLIQVLRAPRPAPIFTIQPGQGWCVSQGAGLNASNGTPNLNGIAAVSPTDAWAVGSSTNQPIIEHWNGTFWRAVTSPQLNSENNGLYGVAAISTSDVWAVGTMATGIGIPGASDPSLGTQPLIEHWDGQQWSIVQQQRQASGSLSSLAFTGKKIWSVGTSVTGPQQIPNPLIETNC
jgi:hypothetical protein